MKVKASLVCIARAVIFVADLVVTLRRVIVELLGDGHGEVGEVDVLVLRTGPSTVATCSPSRSILDCIT